MADRKQVELLGGGYAQPYLPLINLSDRIGQIELLTTEIRRCLGKRPRGCVLSDFAWEQQLASTLQTAGMDYTFLPDTAFIQSGLSGDMPCITEDQGRTIAVLPLLKTYQNGLPRELDQFFTDLEKRLRPENILVCLLLPGGSVVDIGPDENLDDYLRPLFDRFQEMSGECDFISPSRFLKTQKKLKRAYFPSTALREGIISSSKIANLYARMHFAGTLVNQLRGDKARKKNAREEIWKAQDGMLYGLSGDQARSSRRMMASAYRSLMEAERISRDKGPRLASIIQSDIDFDGHDEFIYQGTDYSAFIHREGALITELDILSLYWNLLNLPECGARREGIFRDGVSGLERERISPIEGLYSLENKNRSHSDILFSYEGLVSFGAAGRALRVEKRYNFKKNACLVQIALTNIGTEPIHGHYHSISQLSTMVKEVCSCKLNPKEGSSESLPIEIGNQRFPESQGISVVDERGKVHYEIAPLKPTLLMLSAIADHHESGSSVAGCRFDFSWPLNLAPTERFETGLSLSLSPRRAESASHP